MTIQRVTAPVALPVSLEELKAHLRVTSAAEEALIEGALEVAIFEVEERSGVALMAQTLRQFSPSFGPVAIELERGPLIEIEGVTARLRDGSVASVDLNLVDVVDTGDGQFLEVTEWPGVVSARADAVAITYQAGHATAAEVPAPLRHAVKLLAAHRFEHREEVVIGAMPAPMPNSAESLINLVRRRWVT